MNLPPTPAPTSSPAPDPSRRKALPTPEVEAALLDLLRGEEADAAGRETRARLGVDPALEVERQRLGRFLERVRAAHEPTPDPAEGRRLAVWIRTQVASEEEAAARRTARAAPASRRLLWVARVLAVSVAVHVAVLGAITFQVIREEAPEGPSILIGSIPTGGFGEDWADVPTAGAPAEPGWEGLKVPTLPEERARAQGASPTEGPDAQELPPLEEPLRDHPRAVALDMLTRRIEVLKRRRLDRYGLDANGTMAAVTRGLAALEHRQRADGSFPEGGGRSSLGQTALAVLPFQAEGHGSLTGSLGPPVVAPAIAWIRARLFASGPDRPEEGAPVGETAMALRALSEDYVLCWGRLSPAEGRRRATELQALASALAARQHPEGDFGAGLSESVWAMWALEAAVRTGVVAPPPTTPARFGTWLEGRTERGAEVVAAGLLLGRELGVGVRTDAAARARVVVEAASRDALDPFFLAVAGSGLLLHAPEAFREWNREVGERLLGELGPTGAVWKGDVVGDTALRLLALQVAYRTY